MSSYRIYMADSNSRAHWGTPNGHKVYDSSDPAAVNYFGFMVTGATLKKELNKPHSLSINAIKVVEDRADWFGGMNPYQTIVQVVLVDSPTSMHRMFYGRLTSSSIDLDGQIQMQCEGSMAFLDDTVVFPWNLPEYKTKDKAYTFPVSNDNSQNYVEMSIESYLKFIVGQHDELVGGTSDPRAFTGAVAPGWSTGNQTFVRDNYETPGAILQNDLVDYYGGYIRTDIDDGSDSDTAFDENVFVGFDQSDTHRKLSYVAIEDYSSGATQDISYGVNLIEYEDSNEPDEYFNRLMSFGKEDSKADRWKTTIVPMASQDPILWFDVPAGEYLMVFYRPIPSDPYIQPGGRFVSRFATSTDKGATWSIGEYQPAGWDETVYSVVPGSSSDSDKYDSVVDVGYKPGTATKNSWRGVTVGPNNGTVTMEKAFGLKLAQGLCYAKIVYAYFKNNQGSSGGGGSGGESEDQETSDDILQNGVPTQFYQNRDTLTSLYPVIKQETFENVKSPDTLKKKSINYCVKYAGFHEHSYSVKAVDLAIVNGTGTKFAIGQKLKVVGPSSGIPFISKTQTCISIEYDLMELGVVSMELGTPLQTLSSMTQSSKKGRKKS